MNDRQDNNKSVKRSYQTPELVRIALRAGEAVLGACRKPSGGPAGPGNSTCAAVGACHTLGS